MSDSGLSELDVDVAARDIEEIPIGDLANVLEANKSVRAKIMEHPLGQLTRWPCENTVGLKSVKAMGLNAAALTVFAGWWVKWEPDAPKCPSVDLMRREVHGCENQTIKNASNKGWLLTKGAIASPWLIGL